MSKTTADLIAIVKAGGGLIITKKRSTADLISIAMAAKKSGVKILIRETKTTPDMISIAKAGGDCVSFEI